MQLDLSMVTAPVSKRRRDWFRILRELARVGVSMADVARACCRNHSTVKAWQYEAEPKESDARIVLALLAKHAPDEYAKQQAEFGIRAEVEATIIVGEQRRLGFVEVR